MNEDDLSATERQALLRIAARLERERAIPSAGFRSRLRGRLARRRIPPPRPAQLGRLIAAHGGAGALLLAIAALGVAGTGPLS